jgi:ferritin-like metal-binding protein YciE
MATNNLRDIFTDQLKDIYSAEKQLTEALPKLVQAASADDLKQVFQRHLDDAKSHVSHVKQLLDQMNIDPGNKSCKGMEGLIAEANEMAKKKGDAQAIDAGLIAAVQKMEHYEIATYGTLRAWAETLGETETARKLQSILDEEYKDDKTLTNLAERHINREAAS